MRRGYKDIYRPQQMYDIGNGDMTSCCFDFSSISSQHYEGFFNGLPQLLYKKVKEARFCLDNYLKLNNEQDQTDAQLNDLDQSIYTKKSNYSHYLAKVIWRVLPSAKILVSLTVDSIPLQNDEFSKIVDAIRKNKSLRSVTFRNTLIRDDDFVYFLEKVSPYRFEQIEFTNCQLTSNIYNKVCEFLNSQPPASGAAGNLLNQEWKLRVFKLDENDISPENMDVIDAMMQKKMHPNDTDDQPTITTEEGNQSLTERSRFNRGRGNRNGNDDDDRKVISIREREVKEEYEYEYYEDDEDGTGVRRRRTNTNININIHHHRGQQLTNGKENTKSMYDIERIKMIAATVKPSSPSKNLKDENEKLRRELDELIRKVHAIKYSDDVFLIGEDAEKNLEDIRIAEQHIQAYENKHGEVKI